MMIALTVTACGIQKHQTINTASSNVRTSVDSTFATTSMDQMKSLISEVITESADTSVTTPGWAIHGSVRQGSVALPQGGFITFKKDETDSFTITLVDVGVDSDSFVRLWNGCLSEV